MNFTAVNGVCELPMCERRTVVQQVQLRCGLTRKDTFSTGSTRTRWLSWLLV